MYLLRHDFTHGSSARITLARQDRIAPVISPSGKEFIFSQGQENPSLLLTRRGAEDVQEPLLQPPPKEFSVGSDWHPQENRLLFQRLDPATGWDLWTLQIYGDRKPVPYL